eukprot:TRINITY_DN41877_c0_g1_i1.p1 TRINITY_DN41877_c0_g1~~TRINITY_DN41877_c0_g1_i1.p1  ORF type:complete len:870 (+),score=156.27 TRINITY_DN41877_c0_g1_i1:258-2612(+)
MAADRQGSPSRIDLQQAFLRMDGVRNTCNMMMLRLSDEEIVGFVINVLVAAVQNSPLAAEAFQRDGLNNLKLVLRSIERHQAHWEVAEAGCKLIGHLCSCTAADKGDNMPSRTKAHRDCQNVLAREGGMDVAVNILELYNKEVKDLANRAEVLKQQKIKDTEHVVKSEKTSPSKPNVVMKPAASRLGLKDRIMKVQSNLEVRNAWQKLIDKEIVAGKVQEAAVQALNLLIAGNADATRQLAGTLWVQHINVVLDVGESFLDRAEKKVDDRRKRKLRRQGRLVDDSDSEDSSDDDDNPNAKIRKKGIKTKLPTGESRKSMTSLESLSHKLHMSVEVLRGRVCKDRPSLAVKACVLALQLLKYHKTLLEKVDANEVQMRREAAIRGGARVVEEDRSVKAPFHMIFTTVAAVVSTIRTHIENSNVITSAMKVLAELRANALLSVPAGMQAGGSSAVKAFQALLREAGGNDVECVMRQAARRLVSAAKTSEQGDHRIAMFGKSPSDLEGNGEWLTPRMRNDAKQAQLLAEVLAGDGLQGSWADKGEPGRWEQVLTRREALAATARLNEEKRQAAEMGMSIEEYHAHIASTVLVKAADDESSLGSGSMSIAEDEMDPMVQDDENLMGEQEWVRAVGFGVHDQADFDRVWRKPITEAILRCLPKAAPKESKWARQAEQKRNKLIAEAEKLGVSLDDSLDELLVVEMLESEQGKLKVQATVRPQDKIQSNVIYMRKPESSAASITRELSNSLTKSGCLIPSYGLGVKLNRRTTQGPSLAALKKSQLGNEQE